MKRNKYLLLLAIFGFLSNGLFAKEVEIPTVKENGEAEIPENVSLWLKEELSKSTTTVLENFESPAFFTNKTAKVIGYIKNYDKERGAKTVMFRYKNELTREDKPLVLKIHEDGRFEMELPLDFPMRHWFTIHRKRIPFYLEPGQSLSVILDWDTLNMGAEFSVPTHVSYQGGLEEINTKLNYFTPKFDYNTIRWKIINMSPDVFKKEQLTLQQEHLNKIEAYRLSGAIDTKTSILLKDEIIVHATVNIMDYFGKRRSHQLTGVSKEKIEIPIPEDYYDFIKDLALEKQSFLVDRSFGTLVNRLEFSPPLRDIKGAGFSYTYTLDSNELVAFFLERKEVLTKEEVQLIEAVAKMNGKVSKELSESYTNFLMAHEFEIQEYHAIGYRKKYVSHELKMWNKKDTVVENLGFKDDLMYEIIKLRTLNFMSESLESDQFCAYWEELKKDIKSPYLLKVGNAYVLDKESKKESMELPEKEPGTKLFKELIQPYQGKIIVVQFWSPSSFYKDSSLKKFLARKKKYDDNKKVAFLYVADDMYANNNRYIKMCHDYGFKNNVTLSSDDYNYMRQLFQFNKSLLFVLIGENGELLDPDFAFHNIEPQFHKRFNISPEK
tara:strand:+ start:964 stop:2790 length:1827 start_codon:yes stop_codon:yes gene_type:complete